MSGGALVVGAGAVGEGAALALRAAGWRVRATSRNPQAERPRLKQAGVDLATFDLTTDNIAPLIADMDAVVLTPPLSLSIGAAPALAGKRVIAFSSNNVALDAQSPVYRALAAAEEELRGRIPTSVILRPTLIYGDPRLATLPSVMRWAKRRAVLPVPGSGRALQQPVFHEDLGRIAAALAQSDAHAGATFALGGPDVLSMRALFERAASAVGARPLIVPAPAWALRLGASLMGARFPLDAAQIARVEQDRVAVAQTPLPDELRPQTTLRDGLARLAAAL
ncbi:MAG TPA: hypothetical protein VG841_12760 [Caulobacterales bacterium]|nr:hypothetical protein [Caulobacterales bacterium]